MILTQDRTDTREPDISDTLLAAQLFLQSPHAFGGICLRGYGPVRDELVAQLQTGIAKNRPVIKIPASADSERLLGGIDLTATLAQGRSVHRRGLLTEAAGGAVILPMAERMAEDVAAHIAQAMDMGDLAVILLDDGIEADEAPPKVLMERIAFHCNMSAARELGGELSIMPAAPKVRPLTKKQRHDLAATAAVLGIVSVRPLLFAQNAARAHAALYGQAKTDEVDMQAAVRLIFGPRATQLPNAQEDLEEPPPPPPEDRSDNDTSDADDEESTQNMPPEDMLLEAAAAAIPPHILEQIDGQMHGISKGQAGRSGQKQKSAQRGRPLGSRPGIPGHGRKLALIDTLRAAAPWQTIRRQAAGDPGRSTVHIRKSDLHVRHYEQRRESLTIFAVDASGSSALARLAEAKGAVELMLAEAYVKRAQVALVAFRQAEASLLLPPTRSLTRARRALSALPGGGGTPLALGLLAARGLAEAALKRGQTPTIVLLTDGKANVMMDGSADRKGAMEEVQQIAQGIAAQGLNAITLDISPRPRAEAAQLADWLRGKYLPLPRANSAAMVQAIESVNEGQKA